MSEQPRFLMLGNGHYLNVTRILAIMRYDPNPSKRIVNEARASGLLLDYRGSHAAKGVIVTDTGVVILSPLRPQDINRIINAPDGSEITLTLGAQNE